LLGYPSLLWRTHCSGTPTPLCHHPAAEYAAVCGCSVAAGRVTWDRYRPGVYAAGKGAVVNPGSAPAACRCRAAWHRLLVGAKQARWRVLVWARLGAWGGAVALCSALGTGLRGCWVWVGVTWMLPCRGPRPGGDVICGGARARLESRDLRLGAGSEPAELALLLGSNRARLESRVLRLGAGSEPAELDGTPSLFTPG
jgi:hypothetical protein